MTWDKMKDLFADVVTTVVGVGIVGIMAFAAYDAAILRSDMVNMNNKRVKCEGEMLETIEKLKADVAALKNPPKAEAEATTQNNLFAPAAPITTQRVSDSEAKAPSPELNALRKHFEYLDKNNEKY